MLEYIDLSEWKHKQEIIKELSEQEICINERTLRQEIKRYNQKFYNHEVSDFIAHSSKGYKLTSNSEEILESIKDNHKRALDMLYEEAKVKKAIGQNYNMKIIIDENGFAVVEV